MQRLRPNSSLMSMGDVDSEQRSYLRIAHQYHLSTANSKFSHVEDDCKMTGNIVLPFPVLDQAVSSSP